MLLRSSLYVLDMGEHALLLDFQASDHQHYRLLPNAAGLFSRLTGGTATREEYEMAMQYQWIEIADEVDTQRRIPQLASCKVRLIPLLPRWLEAFILWRQVHQILQQGACLSLITTLMAFPVTHAGKRDPRLQKMLEAVSRARQWSGGQMTCLHYSLVLCWMLRRRSISAQVAIRLQLDPLMGHMIVVDGNETLSWKAGLPYRPTLAQFFKDTTLLFHSGEMERQYRICQPGE